MNIIPRDELTIIKSNAIVEKQFNVRRDQCFAMLVNGMFQLVFDLGETIRKNATPAQVALAWVLAQKPWIVPIPGTTKLHRLEENLEADQLVLTNDDLSQIESTFSQISAHGHRYPQHLAKLAGR